MKAFFKIKFSSTSVHTFKKKVYDLINSFVYIVKLKL